MKLTKKYKPLHEYLLEKGNESIQEFNKIQTEIQLLERKYKRTNVILFILILFLVLIITLFIFIK